jgi:bud site selection protein 20
MGKVMRRKGNPAKNKALKKAKRTRRYGRDID